MINDLAILDWASSMARHAAGRHKVIAENIANADTPGYRARDVKDFSTLVNDGFTPRATRGGHHTETPAGMPAMRAQPLDLPSALNGNSVNLEDQMMRAVEAQGQHRLALTVYEKTLDIVRLGLGRFR